MPCAKIGIIRTPKQRPLFVGKLPYVTEVLLFGWNELQRKANKDLAFVVETVAQDGHNIHSAENAKLSVA